MTNKRILVTGASGFVGRPLVAQLLGAGYTVRAATRGLESFPSSVEAVTIPDFTNAIDWQPILADVSIVIHLAGLAHADIRAFAPRTFDMINRLTTQNLARAARLEGVERFVFVSSARAQVGSSAPRTISERDEPCPTNDYGRSKLAAETAVAATGMPFTILRPVVIYGPRPKGNIKGLMQLASKPLPLPFSGFQSRRSMLGIDNFISAVSFVLTHSTTVNETFLVADPASYTLAEIITMMRKAQGRRPGLFFIPTFLFHAALRLIGYRELWTRLGEDLIVDTSKLQALGWHATVDTYQGIVAMMRAAGGANSR